MSEVADAASGSTVPRRRLGRLLRDLRNAAGLKVDVVARELEWSETTMWRIERGFTSIRSRDVEAMCSLYGADPELTQALMGLALETKSKGWWHAYGDAIPYGFDLYIGLEEYATDLNCYQAELVPGLFQTPAYAKALIRAHNPEIDDEEIERRVALRTERKRILTRKTAPPAVNVVLNEAILQRPVGGPAVMVEQIHQLLSFAELENVSIRVVPFQVGLHHGVMTGPFVIMRFPSNGESKLAEPPTVYVSGYTGDLYLDKPVEIERYDAAFARIGKSALNDDDSKEVMRLAERTLAE